MTANIVVDSFPNYESIIPKDSTNKAIFVTAKLKEALHRMSQFIGKTPAARFTLEPGKDMVLTSYEIADKVPLSYTGAPISVLFNVNYINDILKAVGKVDMIEMSIKDSSSPAIFVPVNPSDNFFSQHIVMTMYDKGSVSC